MPMKKLSMYCSLSSPASVRLLSSCACLSATLIVCGCHSSQPSAVAPSVNSDARDPRYPAEGWTPIVQPKQPKWEILPQEAGHGEVILSNRNELGILSNVAAAPFEFHGKRYASLEGFWQSMKYPEGPDDPRAKFPGLEWKHTRAEVE